MNRGLKSELLFAHIYDMSLVARLTDQINTVLNQFDIRRNHRPFTVSKLVSLAVYFGICRMVHPSRRTLGEELVGLYPATESYSRQSRLKWLLSQLSVYVLFWGALPLLDQPKYAKFSEILKAITVSLSDTWFLLARTPTATSLLEEKMRPASIFPTVSADHASLRIPEYVYRLAACAVIARTVHAIYSVCVSSSAITRFAEPNLGGNTKEYGTDTSAAFDPCLICMGAIESPTALICGHVLCWSCAMSWTTSKVDGIGCPSCRTPCKPQDLVPLVHYAPSSADWEPAWKKTITIR